RNNLLGALNILELSRLYRTARVIIASTVHVYGDSPLPYYEDQPPRPSRPYETSKTCADLLAQSYADSFHLPVLIPRFVNIYGPGDLNFNRVIPKTIKSLLFGESPTIWDGKAQREYLYISDAVRAYDLLAQMTDKQIEGNRIYNFGTGELISVSDLMHSIIRLSEVKAMLKHITPARPHELPKQLVSFEKARRVLGWKPEVKLAEGLKLTLAWYRDYFKMKT
ncbi:MAG: NAD-dependent epimerase/dehydratase family protein, partial [Patescibacteria group bacterium]